MSIQFQLSISSVISFLNSHSDLSFYFDKRYVLLFFFFFFQAEDGIRDVAVTGVQTCALPISFVRRGHRAKVLVSRHRDGEINAIVAEYFGVGTIRGSGAHGREVQRKRGIARSEERRVGKECRDSWSEEQ